MYLLAPVLSVLAAKVIETRACARYGLQVGVMYSKSSGSFGVALAFSIWLYWTGFVILIGAQFNSELVRESKGEPGGAAAAG